MSNLKKIPTIQEELASRKERDEAYWKIRYWYAEQLAKHKQELPEEEFKIARGALLVFMRKATEAYNRDDPIIHQYWKETIWFILPWRVTLWYSVNKKK